MATEQGKDEEESIFDIHFASFNCILSKRASLQKRLDEGSLPDFVSRVHQQNLAHINTKMIGFVRTCFQTKSKSLEQTLNMMHDVLDFLLTCGDGRFPLRFVIGLGSIDFDVVRRRILAVEQDSVHIINPGNHFEICVQKCENPLFVLASAQEVWILTYNLRLSRFKISNN